MPPMTVLGWFHTVVGAAAILMAILLPLPSQSPQRRYGLW